MIGLLPTSLEVNGRAYEIRSDFRDIFVIFSMLNDPEILDSVKAFNCIRFLYKDYSEIPAEDYQEAFDKAVWFMDCGEEQKEESLKLFDWEKDANIIFPVINKVSGFPVRSCEYLHWWDFIGYFNEIDEGLFSYVLGIRQKLAKGKRLDKSEKEFARSHPELVRSEIEKKTDDDLEFFQNILKGGE